MHMLASSGTPRDIRNHGAATSCISAADGGVPLSCILTSASLHDSQVAIPLATLTAARVTNLYDLMDSAYDAPEIRAHSESLGHVAIIDANPRSASRKLERKTAARAQRAVGHVYAEQLRYRERTTVERVSSPVRRSPSPRARSRQGAVPPDVRHGGADSVAVDAPLNETDFVPPLTSCRRPVSAGPRRTGLLIHRQGNLIVAGLWPLRSAADALTTYPMPKHPQISNPNTSLSTFR